MGDKSSRPSHDECRRLYGDSLLWACQHCQSRVVRNYPEAESMIEIRFGRLDFGKRLAQAPQGFFQIVVPHGARRAGDLFRMIVEHGQSRLELSAASGMVMQKRDSHRKLLLSDGPGVKSRRRQTTKKRILPLRRNRSGALYIETSGPCSPGKS